MEEERPVHHEYNVSTGETTLTPFTDEEWEEHKNRSIQHAADQQTKAEEDQKIRDMVSAHPDPLVQLLAKRAGLG